MISDESKAKRVPVDTTSDAWLVISAESDLTIFLHCLRRQSQESGLHAEWAAKTTDRNSKELGTLLP